MGVMLIFIFVRAGISQLIMHEIGWTKAYIYIYKSQKVFSLKHRQSKR